MLNIGLILIVGLWLWPQLKRFKMPFQQGNKLAKGRPVGSKNKATDVQKFELQEI